MRIQTGPCILVALLAWAGGALADEGMWTFDAVPVRLLEERYGFTPTREWLDHLRLSSVDVYASGSFVSPDGLILTNHHVALGSLQRLSTAERNYVRDGFLARRRDEEIPIPGMVVRVLQSIEDVTASVKGAASPGASAAEAKERRDAAMAEIAERCFRETGLRGEVISLYGGAMHHLYRFREYTDVRVVFAPELQAAFFGGDSDNFTYPRYDLDVALLRAYENGKPARVPHWLRVDPEGASDGELIFVSGHPAATDRLKTVGMLEYERDVVYPARIARYREMRAVLAEYSRRGAEQARRARTRIFGIENSLKSLEGELRGLRSPALLEHKRAEEQALRGLLEKDTALAPYTGAWADLQAAAAWAKDRERDRVFKLDLGSRGVAGLALRILRYAAERAKPDGERLEGYHEAEIPDLLRELQSPSPIHKDMEEAMLAWELETLRAGLGSDDPYVETLLRGLSPAEVAKAAVEGTKLDDVQHRLKLLADQGRAVAACDDPLIALVRRADPVLRETRKLFRDHYDAVVEQSLTTIAKAGFAVYGTETYPDATGSLRLAFGRVAGYPFATTVVPPFTTFFGLFDRAASFGNRGDFSLPPRAAAHRKDLDLATPLNFVNTADITGGNSGSPVVDREGRLVGLVFDGNQESHPNTFVYDETAARCVAVDIRGILEALRKLYGAGTLADEILAAAAEKRRP